MSTNQGPEIENRQTGKSGDELLSRMRGLAKEVIRPLETISSENENADVLEALSALDQIESSSRFAAGRSLHKASSLGFGRLHLEMNLSQLKASAGEKIVFDSVNPGMETEPMERLGAKIEDEEKRKIHKAEKALRHLLALNEC